MSNSEKTCPCGSNNIYSNCCEPFHKGNLTPEKAEQLMRARYSAYALQFPDFLISTTHPSHRSSNLRESILETFENTTWIGLEVQSTEMGQAKDKIGKVRFEATYLQEGKMGKFCEYSRFKRHQGKWHYCDAIEGNLQPYGG